MQSDWIVRKMVPTDVVVAASWAAAEGWVGDSLMVYEGIYRHNPEGCFTALINDQIVGIILSTLYGRRGFIGPLIVLPDVRSVGLGGILLNYADQNLREHGAGTTFLDGVVKAVSLYERNGFIKICQSLRFKGKPVGRPFREVRPMYGVDLPEVLELDRRMFGEDRTYPIVRRMGLHPELSQVLLQEGRIRGYIQGRQAGSLVTVGPWVVDEQTNDPEKLLFSLALVADCETINLGILETNSRAVELVRSQGFEEGQNHPWRMAKGPSTDLGISSGCFAVGAPATG